MTIRLCPRCDEPLWFMACRCGWQAEPRLSDRSPEAREAYAWQAQMYASQVNRCRPSSNPFEVPGTTAHQAIENYLHTGERDGA